MGYSRSSRGGRSIDRPADPAADRSPLRALLLTQALGAFNDNAWKMFVIVLGARGIAGLSGGEAEEASQARTMLAFVVFTLPLFLFSIPAGALADRISKRTLIVRMKALELGLMATGAVVLATAPDGLVLPLVVLGLMGLQSALFSPAKYGILPELVSHARLSAANGALEMWTFVAIITGTAVGPMVLSSVGESEWVAGVGLATLSLAGWIVAQRIPTVPAARSDGEGVRQTVAEAWRAVRADRVLWLSIVGAAWFWAVANLLGQDIFVYSRLVLGLSEQATGLPLGLFGLGVGVGSVLAGRLSDDKVEMGLIPLGAVGLGLGTLVFGAVGPGLAGTFVLMGLLGVSSGLLLVPLNALLQWRSPADRRGAVIALGNVVVFAGMLMGSLSGWLMAGAGLSPRGILVGASLLTLAGTAWALWLLPESFLRLVIFLFTHVVYRVKTVGREHVPRRGGALLTPNHVSLVDGLFLLTTTDRPIRFLIDAERYNRRLSRPLLRILRAIPISSMGGMKGTLRALRDAGEHLDRGELVCIFPEGQITRTGTMQPFRRGLERIAKGRAAPIVPVHLDRVWGSIFSFKKGRFVRKLPERLPYPVTVSFGAPMPSDTSPADVRAAVLALGEQAWYARKPDRRPIHHGFVTAVRRGPWKLAMADGTRPRVSRFAALAGAVALARALRPRWRGSERVGILLPPSVAGALVNVAASLAGRTAVNLNFTAGAAGMTSAAQQAGLKSVVTSRAFVEKASLELPEGVEPVWLEDVAPSIGKGARLLAAAAALSAPERLLERLCGARRAIGVDDVLTIIFSSGSTGDPKGVMLTHFNLDSNVEAVGQVFRLGSSDRLLGILPLFHSFGTMSLWFGLNHRAPLVFHPNPLDGPAVGKLVHDYGVTILLATPTFLSMYLRRCTPEQFGSLRIVLAGAEKLSERLVGEFDDTFGIRPIEGYGATECSPVIATSVPSFRARGFFQPGARRGSVGLPVPGVALRIVDPDSREPLPPGEAGLLLVRGPNVMKGYLGRDDLTEEVLRDGWYVTGDIARIDEDGFLFITDRLSRFSKIGGEMVPHGRVETALHEAYGQPGEQRFAVTAVPDERKGERLTVVTTVTPDEVPPLVDALGRAGLPNLFIPRADAFVHVDAIPLLGTGKTDLRGVKRIAAEALGG